MIKRGLFFSLIILATLVMAIFYSQQSFFSTVSIYEKDAQKLQENRAYQIQPEKEVETDHDTQTTQEWYEEGHDYTRSGQYPEGHLLEITIFWDVVEHAIQLSQVWDGIGHEVPQTIQRKGNHQTELSEAWEREDHEIDISIFWELIEHAYDLSDFWRTREHGVELTRSWEHGYLISRQWKWPPGHKNDVSLS